MKKQIDVMTNIPFSIFKEGDFYIAYCPVLDLATNATTFELVKKRFVEAVRIFLDELVDMGTLDEVLTNLGWIKTSTAWNPPIQVSHEIEHIKVPLSA